MWSRQQVGQAHTCAALRTKLIPTRHAMTVLPQCHCACPKPPYLAILVVSILWCCCSPSLVSAGPLPSPPRRTRPFAWQWIWFPSNQGSYDNATFCFIPYGHGWGSRIFTAMVHMCIPVIMQASDMPIRHACKAFLAAPGRCRALVQACGRQVTGRQAAARAAASPRPPCG